MVEHTRGDMSSGDSPVVLVADPNTADREAASDALSSELDAHVLEAVAFESATETIRDEHPDCVVTEYDLPDGTGLELVGWIREHAPDTPCVLYTEAPTDEIRTEAFQDVVVEYFPKSLPDAPEGLANLVRNVLSQRSQLAYPLPDDEDERLAAIEQYDLAGLDTVKTVERLTELAANHFRVTVAFAGVVDAHEERLVGCHGADWERFDREDTICTHTVLADGPTTVEDTHRDTRFANIEVLSDLDIRSYAGVPLTTPGGLPIGALCLINDEPRAYDDAELADLELFADELMEQLELRRRLSESDSPEVKG